MTLRPVGAGASVIIAGTATTSSAFRVRTNALRVVAKGKGCHVAIGTDPVATTANFYVAAGEPETLAMTKASQVVASVTKGTTTVITAPEGTQMPFNLGDRVTLDAPAAKIDSNWLTLINDTKVVGKSRSAGVGGDFLEKITVEANTAGIATAFSPTTHATLFMSNKVSVISPNPTAAAVAYIQQVQTTGSA